MCSNSTKQPQYKSASSRSFSQHNSRRCRLSHHVATQDRILVLNESLQLHKHQCTNMANTLGPFCMDETSLRHQGDFHATRQGPNCQDLGIKACVVESLRPCGLCTASRPAPPASALKTRCVNGSSRHDSYTNSYTVEYTWHFAFFVLNCLLSYRGIVLKSYRSRETNIIILVYPPVIILYQINS